MAIVLASSARLSLRALGHAGASMSADPCQPPIRVASVPAGHVYVRHLAAPAGADGVVRLDDVTDTRSRPVPHGWYPPLMLDPAWVVDNAGTFDVFHVHFGFDGRTPSELHALADALDVAGVPLVLTVHDLRNPHHPDRGLHDAQLDALLDRSAEVITLTTGAAQAIAARSGHRATVLAHPHVVPLDQVGRPRPVHDGAFIVGLHAKSVRPNMGIVDVAEALAVAVETLPAGRLRIDLHDEVGDATSRYHDPVVVGALEQLAQHPAIDLRRHGYFADAELWDYLRAIDVSVLPYRFGTHSGWLEACHDLGTAVIAPTCGFYAQQRPCHSYGLDEDGLDARSLAQAVHAAHAEWSTGTVPRADATRRHAERVVLATAHRRLYERALASRTVPAPNVAA